MSSSSSSSGAQAAGLTDRVPNWLVPNLSGLHVAAVLIALLLIGLLLVPVAQVMIVAFQDPATGAATLQNFVDFFGTSLFRESFWNSFYIFNNFHIKILIIF